MRGDDRERPTPEQVQAVSIKPGNNKLPNKVWITELRSPTPGQKRQCSRRGKRAKATNKLTDLPQGKKSQQLYRLIHFYGCLSNQLNLTQSQHLVLKLPNPEGPSPLP